MQIPFLFGYISLLTVHPCFGWLNCVDSVVWACSNQSFRGVRYFCSRKYYCIVCEYCGADTHSPKYLVEHLNKKHGIPYKVVVFCCQFELAKHNEILTLRRGIRLFFECFRTTQRSCMPYKIALKLIALLRRYTFTNLHLICK